MAKNKYTPEFDKFWSAYPRKTAKTVAFKAWVKNGIDGDAFLPKQVIQDVEKRSRLKWWPRDHSKVPHAATWINQARWEDEGWENEIKTREDGTQTQGRYYPPPTDDPGPQLDRWQAMMNRLMLSYIRAAGGISDSALNILVQTKNEVHAELVGGAIEEVAGAKNKAKAIGEMGWLFADMMVSRFDAVIGRSLKRIVIDSKPVLGS